MLGKNLVPEIWAKMLLVNQIAGFLNLQYLMNKVMKKLDFVDKDSWILKLIEKYGDGHGEKWV